MKRTPIRPGRPPERRSRIAAGERQGWNSTLAPGGPLPAGRRHRKCYAHLRDEPFKAWARAEGCILAGRPGHVCDGPVEFAHDRGEGIGGADRGNGAGLCRYAGHQFGPWSFHQLGPESFDARWQIDFTAICRTLGDRYERHVG